MRVTVLGATGSIGRSTLDLLASHREKYQVEALVADKNVPELAKAARRVGAKRVVISDQTRLPALKERLSGENIICTGGMQAVLDVASIPVDRSVVAIVGCAALAPLCAAITAGSTIALANKESLVCAGRFVMDLARRHNVTILPVDSEHNALFQILGGQSSSHKNDFEKLVLTASGGPFREMSLGDMAQVTPQQALSHPKWCMGQRITINSATLMNKGFEVIEACHLFSVSPDQVDVVVHPESIVHALVQYNDGSVLAQMAVPDMRIPISHCLCWPLRAPLKIPVPDLPLLSTLTFQKPDKTRFPALALAYRVARENNGAACALNSADEVAVDAFLTQKIGFLDMISVIEETLDRLGKSGELREPESLEAALESDTRARQIARDVVANGEW